MCPSQSEVGGQLAQINILPHLVSPPEDTNSKKPNQQTSTQRHQHQERSSLCWCWHRTRSGLQEWTTPTERSWRHHCRKKRERSQCGLPTEAEELRGVVWEPKQALLGLMGSPNTLGNHATQRLCRRSTVLDTAKNEECLCCVRDLLASSRLGPRRECKVPSTTPDGSWLTHGKDHFTKTSRIQSGMQLSLT